MSDVPLEYPAILISDSFGVLELPEHLRSLMVDVCVLGDVVCESVRLVIGAHVNGHSDLVGVAPRRAVAVVLGTVFGPPGIH